jgi:hypothetical protein
MTAEELKAYLEADTVILKTFFLFFFKKPLDLPLCGKLIL